MEKDDVYTTVKTVPNELQAGSLREHLAILRIDLKNARTLNSYEINGNPSVHEAFQKAITACPGMYCLWKPYLEFQVKTTHHCLAQSLELCLEKGVINFERCFSTPPMHLMPRLCILRVELFLAAHEYTQARESFNISLCQLPRTQHALLWKHYLALLSRSHSLPPHTLTSALQRVVLFDSSYFEKLYERLLVQQDYAAAFKVVLSHTKHIKITPVAFLKKHPLTTLDETVKEYLITSVNSSETSPTVLVPLLEDATNYLIAHDSFALARDLLTIAFKKCDYVEFPVLFEIYGAVYEAEVVSSNYRQEILDHFDQMLEKRENLLLGTLLRFDPTNIPLRLHLISSMDNDAESIEEIYVEGLRLSEGMKDSHILWIKFAQWYESQNDLESATYVYQTVEERAKFPHVDAYIHVFCARIEFLLRHRKYEDSLLLLRRATATNEESLQRLYKKQKLKGDPRQHLCKSTRIWSLYVDMCENLCPQEAVVSAYERMLSIGMGDPVHYVSYALFLSRIRAPFSSLNQLYTDAVSTYPHEPYLWHRYLSFVLQEENDVTQDTRDFFSECLNALQVEGTDDFIVAENIARDVSSKETIFYQVCCIVRLINLVECYTLMATHEEKYGSETQALELWYRALRTTLSLYMLRCAINENVKKDHMGFISIVQPILNQANARCFLLHYFHALQLFFRRVLVVFGVMSLRPRFEEIFRDLEKLIQKRRYNICIVLPLILNLAVWFSDYEILLGEIENARKAFKHAAAWIKFSYAHEERPDVIRSALELNFWKKWAFFEERSGSKSEIDEMHMVWQSIYTESQNDLFNSFEKTHTKSFEQGRGEEVLSQSVQVSKYDQ